MIYILTISIYTFAVEYF